ncbi:MAG: putative Rossmann fold flavoprotein [Hyphomicrobiaceae bacterium]|jgi:predicted Rossmann fold flavoprotein
MSGTVKNADKSYDAIILGAGGAGLMCAAVAGQRGRRILLIDHADEPGKKIVISGGGRCNFTNTNTAPDRYISANPHFAKSALGRYTAQDFISLVDKYRIDWHEKTLGQLFCDGPARQIVRMFQQECDKGGVEVALGLDVRDVGHANGQFKVTFGHESASAPALVIATGGPSIPKMGATGFAYELGRQFGLKIVQPRPALVPFTLSQEEILFRELSGVSADVIVSYGKTKFREGCLFTHKGLSGPSILQISSYWEPGQPIGINFFPDGNGDWLIDAKRASPRSTLRRAIAAHLPDRLASVLAERIAPAGDLRGDLGNTSNQALQEAAAQLGDWPFTPNGTEGFAKAEVTAGGISTDGLSSRTMEAKRVPGLYAIGEAVDVTGWLGGYNFQWAWASGWAAGQEI